MLQCHSRDCLPAPLQLNKGGVDFGRRSGGEPVGDVQLPPWAADAADFLYKLSEALEAPRSRSTARQAFVNRWSISKLVDA